MTIWKYSLDAEDIQTLMMPEGAQILTAQMQGNALCLWAMVNPEKAKEKREIEVFGTGHPGSDAVPRRYIGTVQMQGGALVWHIFERLR